VFFAVRTLFNLYEKSIVYGIKEPEGVFLRLANRYSKLIDFQQNSKVLIEEKALEKISTGMNKKRILTYHRDELITIPIENIAFIYLEHTTTYVMSFDGKKSSTNASLDELYSSLDNVTFYRANRQVIINIKTIQKIIKYGNNQLKIIVQPNLETAIIIGKNKASEFKQWLNF
jgi:DNA-binding LytR/AlgR family response regulator